MHRDKKVGLALGILLVGIVAAFFFRNEPALRHTFPKLADPIAIDRQIAEKPVTPYLKEPEGDDHLVKLGEPEQIAASPTPPAPLWEVPDFLKDDGMSPSNPVAQSPAAPDPIHIAPAPAQEMQITDVSQVVPSRRTPKQSTSVPGVRLHRVERGDTLSRLAGRYLQDEGRFQEIFEANRDLLNDPNDLRVGMQIRIQSASERQATVQEPARSTSPLPSIAPRSKSVVRRGNGKASRGGPILQPPEPTAEIPKESSPPPAAQFVPVRRSRFMPRWAGSGNPQIDTGPAQKRTLSQEPPFDE